MDPVDPHHPRAVPLRSQYADDPEMAELVDLFVDELPQRVEALRAAFDAGDAPSLRRLAHQLRGAGAGYGFPAIGEAAGEVETRLRTAGNAAPELPNGLNRQLNDLIDLCSRATQTRS